MCTIYRIDRGAIYTRQDRPLYKEVPVEGGRIFFNQQGKPYIIEQPPAEINRTFIRSKA